MLVGNPDFPSFSELLHAQPDKVNQKCLVKFIKLTSRFVNTNCIDLLSTPLVPKDDLQLTSGLVSVLLKSTQSWRIRFQRSD